MKFFFKKAKDTYNSNKYLKVGIRILISLTLIVYIISNQDINSIKENLVQFKFANLIFALFLLLFGTYFSAIRWQLILKSSRKEVSTIKLFLLYIKGYFYNNFLPTQMGGDVYKAVAVGNLVKDQSLGFFSVFMDRFGGLIVLLILGFFGIASLFGPGWVLFSILLLIAGFYLYFPILKLFSSKIKFFKKFEDASNLLIKDKTNALMILLVSLVIQLFSFATAYILFRGLNITLSIGDVFAYMPIASLATLIPSFNGFGTQETVYAFLFAAAGVTAAASIAVSVMLHVVRLIMSLIGGILILLNLPKE